MATNYQTPGVYVEEIPAFPPSIAQVATAIPVFIGYTQFAIDDKGKSLQNKAFEISSMLEYTTYFGGSPQDLKTTVTLNADNSVSTVATTPSFQMFNALSMFFYNGGGDCYIFSVGIYPTTDKADLNDFIPTGGTIPSCFDVLKKYDEPTLIVVPDAAFMLSTNDFNSLMQEALNHCGNMQSRFTIIDVPQSNMAPETTAIESTVHTDSGTFRNGIVGSNLNYGAAYYPYLETNLPCPSSYSNISLMTTGGMPIELSSLLPPGDMNVLQIINAVKDQQEFAIPYTTIPIPPGAPTPFILDYTTPEDVTTVITGLGKNISIQDAYNSIPVAPSKDRLTDSIKFIADVLVSFVKLNSLFADKQGATGYVNIPSGSTVQEIHSSYINPGTATSFSAIENLLVTLIQVDANYPAIGANPAGIGVAKDEPTIQGWLAGYLKAPITLTPNIYGASAPTSDDAAVAAVIPLINNVLNTLRSMISNFASDVASRINSLDLQIASSNVTYNNIKTAIKNAGLVVPPGATMAGVYAATDGTRGVWKAPANVPLINVIKPTIPIDDDIQSNLNIDPNSGKSINAIRAFTGKGTLVWGARTLTGNDNDFRYISVRRFFIMVEQSTKLAAFQFVFEPNDANTWTRIRAMIENYLTNLWRQGALAGSKPEQSFYVKIGLGQTMIFQDILEGRLIVEIGMAPVRPAEFIILRFTQIQQTS